MPAPDRVYRRVDHHIARWRAAEDRANETLDPLIDDPTNPTNARRLRALVKDIDAEADRLQREARAFLGTHLADVWSLGANSMRIGVFDWSAAHRSALTLLVDDTFSELLRATTHMSQDVKQLVRGTARAGVLGKVRDGTPAKTAGRQLAERLKATGITAVTYSDGRHIRASTYAEMVVRTTTAVSYNAGGLNQLLANDVRYVECVDGAACGLVTHDDGNKANGKVFPVDVAGAYIVAHPSCRRDWIPRQDVSSDVEAAVATSWRDPDQISDQTNFEKYLQATPRPAAGRQPRQPRAATRTPRTPRGT